MKNLTWLSTLELFGAHLIASRNGAQARLSLHGQWSFSTATMGHQLRLEGARGTGTLVTNLLTLVIFAIQKLFANFSATVVGGNVLLARDIAAIFATEALCKCKFKINKNISRIKNISR